MILIQKNYQLRPVENGSNREVMQTNGIDLHFEANKPWRTLFNLYWAERLGMFGALVSYLFKASPIWILPIVTANIIDIISQRPENGGQNLLINGVIGIVAVVQNIFSAAVYISLNSRSIRSVEVRLRSALVRRLQMLSISYHNQTDTGVLQTKITRDIESIELLSRQLIDVGFISIVTILVTWTITAIRIPAFLPVFVVFVPLILLILRFFARRLRLHNENLRREIEGMNSLLFGMINMISVTRAHAVESEEINRAESKFQIVSRAARAFDFAAGTFGASAWVILMTFNLLGFITAAYLSYQGILNLSTGDIVLLSGYFSTIMAAVLQLNAMLPFITRGFDALRSVGEILESPDIEINLGKKTIENIRGEFFFENVRFSYRQEIAEILVLKNINLKVKAGESIGIVGESGSGKSTLASLLIGFHRPTKGRILLDGEDMNSIDLRSFRRNLAVVSQQTILFNGTLRENIIYGSKNISETELRSAIEAANAADFIDELPDRIETEVGQHGVRLSGGQQQRIAIARALLRNPKVLILDEATSALDTESEKIVEEALEKLMIGRTTFIITHTQSILRKVNRIIKIEKGKIVDDSAIL